MNTNGKYYLDKINERDFNGNLKYTADLKASIEEACDHCLDSLNKKDNKPVMLLGRIQSGKTRAYIGLISLIFDNYFDLILVLSKNSKALVMQTERRLRNEYTTFIKDNEIVIKDINNISDEILTKYQIKQKHIIIAKKETKNLDRITKFIEANSINQNKRCLIIDDEADITSIGFQKIKDSEDEFDLRTIANKINLIRGSLDKCVFLQVTATPYALYLQPEFDKDECLPLKPDKTVLLPCGDGYIGSKYYFIDARNNDAESRFIYKKVSDEERIKISDHLGDGRTFKKETLLTNPKINEFVTSIFNFIVGGCTYRKIKNTNEHLAYLVHTNREKSSHSKEADLIENIKDLLKNRKENDLESIVNEKFKAAYVEIKQSIEANGFQMPEQDIIKTLFHNAIDDEEISSTVVNSEKQVLEILDPDSGEIELKTPFSFLIGGQILDRGITIKNLAGFYYGRSPNTMQQDTVMQHSRMFGYRSKLLLSITRFYTTQNIYERLIKITEIEEKLRTSIETGAAGKSFYFIKKDERGHIKPCSPSKIGVSQIFILYSQSRILPIGFSTIKKSYSIKPLNAIDKILNNIFSTSNRKQPEKISLLKAQELLENVYQIIIKDGGAERFISLDKFLDILYFAERNKKEIYLLIRENRNISKFRENKYSDAPEDGNDELKIAHELAKTMPVLTLLKQNGESSKGWDDSPFWWPILMLPDETETSIIALDEPKGRIRKK